MKKLILSAAMAAMIFSCSVPAMADCNTQACDTVTTPYVVQGYDYVKDGTVNVYNKAKTGTVKAYDKTKEGTVKAYNTVKDGTVKAYDKTKNAVDKGADAVKTEWNKIF